ncbi:uncharacterized protein PSFLO_02585 [Pseudozyma flocculosa]|uniref:Uncharacterized protein n=1 Tax=Pseudozyma flocculosa TaxID=84751 RepID=A0A5C3EXX0_9BASI|nr:uncharacterized protein PSFLO_02585 [Pseudozyma flocculosa]
MAAQATNQPTFRTSSDPPDQPRHRPQHPPPTSPPSDALGSDPFCWLETFHPWQSGDSKQEHALPAWNAQPVDEKQAADRLAWTRLARGTRLREAAAGRPKEELGCRLPELGQPASWQRRRRLQYNDGGDMGDAERSF